MSLDTVDGENNSFFGWRTVPNLSDTVFKKKSLDDPHIKCNKDSLLET